MIFQSTPPTRGVTQNIEDLKGAHEFQSTPPTRGVTSLIHNILHNLRFQSTPPTRGVTATSGVSAQIPSVSGGLSVIYTRNQYLELKKICLSLQKRSFFCANLFVILCSLPIRNYAINGPSMFRTFLAPTCSTRFFQSSPR